ncbi:MAG TPA: flagellar export protein FliJ [Pirellulales bacterium]
MSTLLRVRENLRNECHQHLAAAEEAAEIIRNRIADLDEEIVGLRRQTREASLPGPVNIDRLLDAGRYETTVRAARQAAMEQLQTISAEVERRRQALVEADRNVKSLEKLREQQLNRHRAEEARREIKQLDERAILLELAKKEW